MKQFNVIMKILMWIIAIFILLFALATFLGKNFGQTVCLVLAATALIYWPQFLKKRLNNTISGIIRIAFIVLLLGMNFFIFSSDPKTTIYTSEANRQKLMELYDKMLVPWPKETKDIYINTDYGVVHVLTCGSRANPPLVLLHAASMGAPSWAENIEALMDEYTIYAIDNIGEGNKSRLKDAIKFPDTGKEIADLYAAVFDSLQIRQAPVFGASNGGYIAQVLACYYPEKVSSLALFGPMGLTQLSNKSIFMMSVGSMYPLKFIRKAVTHWAIGEDDYCNQKYGDWFDCIIQGTIPSMAHPVPMTKAQKEKMHMPVLLFLGTKDPIVGDADYARKQAQDYPDVETEVLESGHLIAVEHREYVNKRIQEFLDWSAFL